MLHCIYINFICLRLETPSECGRVYQELWEKVKKKEDFAEEEDR